VETQSEREKLMFRVKVRVPSELILKHIDRVKTGVRGVAYVRLSNTGSTSQPEWPEFLKKLPPGVNPTAVKN
jgi:HlyD family secretion protein